MITYKWPVWWWDGLMKNMHELICIYYLKIYIASDDGFMVLSKSK